MNFKYILFFTLFYTYLHAQQPSMLSKFYFLIETTPPQFRWYDTKITKPSEHTSPTWIRSIGDWDELTVGIGTRLNKNINIELGYYSMTYWGGMSIDTKDCIGMESGGNLETGDHFYSKFLYSPFSFNLLHKPLKLYGSLAYTYGLSSRDGWDLKIGTFIRDCENGKVFISNDMESEKGLTKNFHLLSTEIKLDYEFSKYMSLTTAIGFNQGFKVLGIYKEWYEIQGEPKRYYVESTTKGSNFYWSFGLRISPFKDVKKRVEKKKTTKIKAQGRYVD